MKDLGYGKDYKYAHSYDEHFVEENYFPEELSEKRFYFPGDSARERNCMTGLKNFGKEGFN